MESLLEALRKARTLVFDYDGTIAPVVVSREESRVLPGVEEALRRLREAKKIVIATTKDPDFTLPRTSFAHAWVCSNGFAVITEDLVFMPRKALENLDALAEVLGRARDLSSGLEGVVVEPKKALCYTVGFCLDWRPRGKMPGELVEEVVGMARSRRLHVIRYQGRPFIDVFAAAIDKAWGLGKLLELGFIERPVAYFGDSENDYPGFRLADVSVFVLNEESRHSRVAMDVDYVVEQEELAGILSSITC